MDDSGIDLSREGRGGGGGGGGGGNGGGVGGCRGVSAPFIDRSKVRILLYDNDMKSAKEVLELLCKCSYQVTSVRSARQLIDALNAEGHDIDIILTEVDLPMKKGMKMLKYVTRRKELQQIPVIMMSAQDEVSIVVKCLRLGAADYLVKPLRTNELLNLWTHMWRRRHMLGLAEKNILNYDFDLAASDPSDANTNSTTLFSDDTDDKSRKSVNPEMSLPTNPEDETNTQDPALVDSLEYQPDVPGISDRRTGQSSLCLKKSELKIGESSAFFTYVKSSMFKNHSRGAVPADENIAQSLRVNEKSKAWGERVNKDDPVAPENGEAWENNSQGDEFPSSTSFPDSTSLERSCTPPALMGPQRSKSNDEGLSQVQLHMMNGSQFDVSGFTAHAAYPYYMSGAMNQVMMPPSAQVYQKKIQDIQNHTTAMMPHYNHLPHCPSHVPGMTFSYYPMGICLQPGQIPAAHQWPSFGNSTTGETELDKVDRREAALIKFRQKRKERCFDKKIRYVNCKRLAERRPRVRGQFVRKVNGMMVDLNGRPADLEEYDVDDEEHVSRDSSPEDDAS